MRARSRARLFSPPLPFALVLCAAAGTAACGGTSAPGAGPSPGTTASEAEWSQMATPRPEALDGAVRVSLGEVRILANDPWSTARLVDPGLGVAELVAAGLLRRQDVRYVERRRFAAAVEAERRGQPRPEGAPAAGVSPGAELIVAATWSALGLDSAFVELRVSDAQSGAVVGTWRGATANEADPTSLARSIVGGITSALEGLGRLPAWNDPVPRAAPSSYAASGVPARAVEAFLRGLSAEERWDWEGARRGYQEAIAAGGEGFFEARAALARAARLRRGGTLGAG